ncbi:MAG: NAD(P)H-hydrate dehydratase [Ruminococcus sp.]|nr:NAD(P)H-hydrate dehydratase [Ruminococcus sp.]
MDRILTPKQMSEAEQASVKLGVPLGELMDNAGEALAKEILSVAQSKMLRQIVILTGNGNNGGDGLVCADFLAKSGVIPTVILMCGEPKTELSKAAFTRLDKSIKVTDKDSYEFNSIINNAEIIADCVFGTGFHGEIKSDLLPYFEIIKKSQAYKIACDCPSGVNCLNGQISNGTLKCHKTITFYCSKTGLHFHPAKDFCGEITVASIGIPKGCDKGLTFSIGEVKKTEIKKLLPIRKRNSHKGTYGKLMLICGCEQYMGAAALCAKAALRSGVGIVNLLTPKVIAQSLVSAMPECTFTSLKTDENGFSTAENIPMIIERSKDCSAIVIGCGLGVTDGTKTLVYDVIKNAKCPIIIDADGINCLSEHIDVLEEKQAEVILTPHPAELARLCGVSTNEVLSDRIKYALLLAQKYNITIHAKGTQTITTMADGSCFITDFGNTALAKGGSGDLLAGLIGSFMAQGVCSKNACLLASCLMGSTAERLAESQSERGIIASDIISCIPQELKSWESE